MPFQSYRCGTESTGYAGDDASTLAGDTDSVQENKLDTEVWLKNLAIRAAGRDEVTSSSAETLSSLTRLTKKNIMALDLMMSSPKRKPTIFDDGESSVYSVDQEGFYTSFHNDSGLKKSTATLVDEEDLSPCKDSQSIASMCSIESVIHNPEAEKFAGIKRGASKLNKVTPPAPPPRTSSYTGSLSSTGGEGDRSSSSGGLGRQDSSVSDTDQEVFSNRVMSKTQISSTAIPSLCPLLSDEESVAGKDRPDIEGRLMYNGTDVNENSKCEIVDMNQNFEKSMAAVLPAADTENIGKENKGLLPSNPDDDFEHSKTLPRQSHAKQKGLSTFSSYTNSWPRSMNKKKDADSPTKAGILKSNEKSLNETKPPKSLNFSPFVNMIKPGDQSAVQMPLPSPSSSEDSMRVPEQKALLKMADSDSYKLTVPLMQKSAKDEGELPMKYQPTIVVKPGNRSSLSERKGARVNLTSDNKSNVPSDKIFYATGSLISNPSSAPNTSGNPTPYAVSPIKGATQNNPPILTNGGYMDMQGGNSLNKGQFGSINSLESSESLSWSNSLTYVTMASPCSSPNLSNLDVPMLNTPTGSFESLNDQIVSDQSKSFKSADQKDSFTISGNSTLMQPISDTIDNSNLSSTMETVAITTNSFSSFNSTGSVLENKSFKTFTGPIHPPKSSSTPYSMSSPSGNTGQVYSKDQRTSHLPHSINTESSFTPVSRGRQSHRKENVRSSAQTRPADTAIDKKHGIPHSRSFPQEMSNQISSANKSKEPKRTENYRPGRKSLPKGKSGAIVNVQNVSSDGEKSDDSSASNRSDSYRVAMVNPNNCRSGSYRVAMRESLSCPSFQQQAVKQPPISDKRKKSLPVNNPNRSLPSQPVSNPNKSYPSKPTVSNSNKSGPMKAVYYPPEIDPADFNRTDSYRVAVRATQGVVSSNEMASARNSSYRVAVDLMDPVIPDSRLDGLVSRNPCDQVSGRDSRRMGITNVDQLKSVSTNNPAKVDTSKIDTSSVVRRRPKSDVDPISEISSRDQERANNRTGKNSSKRHSTSSTYIKFDPIFELGEDMGVSMDSLKTGSNSSLKMSPEMPHTGYGFSSEKPKVNALQGTKHPTDKSNSSLLGSIKSTIKSISGTNSKQAKEFEIEDDWRFSMV